MFFVVFTMCVARSLILLIIVANFVPYLSFRLNIEHKELKAENY